MGSPDTDPSTRIYVTAAQEDPAWERWRQDREGKKPSEGDVSGEVPAPAWSCWWTSGLGGTSRSSPRLDTVLLGPSYSSVHQALVRGQREEKGGR